MRFRRSLTMVAMAAGLIAAPMVGQSAAAGHASGTVKSTNATSLTLTTPAGQDVTVTVPESAKILVVAPGSKDLKSATTGSLSDVTAGDRALITGTAGEDATTLTATRVVLMKAQAIADTHAAEDAAWAKGGGGIVKSVDAAKGTVVMASGLKTVTVQTTPATVVRRYAGDSVRFADAHVSTIASVQAGDQMRVRGTKSADGTSIAADELVVGTFQHYSGLISSVDAAAGTVTLKDLATKKMVTVAVTSNSDMRRIPAMMAQRIAMQMKGGAGGGPGAGAAGGPKGESAGGAGRNGAPMAKMPADDGSVGARRAGMDLSQMLSRLPTETMAGLKAGDAVMIVATSPSDASQKATAVTLLAGVDAILTASPKGESMTLTPWSVGGDAPTEGGGGGGGAAVPNARAQHAATPQ